jgi:ER membrane protein complex subunit 1
MLICQDSSIHLFQTNTHPWIREESLSSAHSALFLDLPLPEIKSRTHSQKDIFSAYVERILLHIRRLKDLPNGLISFGKHFATGKYDDIDFNEVVRDAFGLRKFIIVITNNKIVAMDSANHGKIIWSIFLQGIWIVRESTLKNRPPLIGVFGEGKYLLLNGLNGNVVYEEIVKEEFVKMFLGPAGLVDSEGRRIIIGVTKDGIVKGLPSTETTSVLKEIGDTLYYSIREDRAVQGYVLDSSLHGIPTWRFQVPQGSTLLSHSSRNPTEKVASIGRVLGDRSVLYKYLNPHLVILALGNSEQSTATIYLIDNVSGRILYQCKHGEIDVSKGITTHIVENVVYWSYYSTGASPGQSRGTRITVAELYESPHKNDKYNLYFLFI